MVDTKEIKKVTRVVATVDAGPLVEISFRGEYWYQCGNELSDYVSQTVHDLKPAGVVMNLNGFKYRWGNGIGSLLVPLLEFQTGNCRPFCVVASGRTAKSLKSLFALMQVPEFANAEYFDDAKDGLEYLEKNLEGGNA